jgi:uncharacterized protein (DUF2235 family)
MTRHVLCLDGTNNYPNAGFTNIQRLFRMLQRGAEQCTYYQPGVGTLEPGSVGSGLAKRALMLADAMSALYIERHVCAAYRYLMVHWQQGDELYLFGFSRGAFVARVLAGMLTRVGLLHPGFDEMVAFAWKAYLAPWTQREDSGARFRRHYARYLPEIRFIGLFDSVSAVGLPWLPQRFAYTFDNPRVRTVRQAFALDERRVMFVQNRWADQPRAGKTDVEQYWFAGNHSDVGGGYVQAEAGLSLISLAWMKGEAEKLGLRFRPKVSEQVFGLAAGSQDELLRLLSEAHAVSAPVHDELHRRRWWWIAEMLPVPRMRRLDEDQWVRTWQINRGKPRRLHRDDPIRVHSSVQRRMQDRDYLPLAVLTSPQYVD